MCQQNQSVDVKIASQYLIEEMCVVYIECGLNDFKEHSAQLFFENNCENVYMIWKIKISTVGRCFALCLF